MRAALLFLLLRPFLTFCVALIVAMAVPPVIVAAMLGSGGLNDRCWEKGSAPKTGPHGQTAFFRFRVCEGFGSSVTTRLYFAAGRDQPAVQIGWFDDLDIDPVFAWTGPDTLVVLLQKSTVYGDSLVRRVGITKIEFRVRQTDL